MNKHTLVNLGEKLVGPGKPCFVTFEAGPTHQGLNSAIRLVRHAASAGADAIKFQILDPERLMADKSVQFSYDILVDRKTGLMETKTESLYKLMQRRAMSRDEWREVKRVCDEVGLLFFATVGFFEEIDFLVEIGAASIKIASADINHFPLIRYAARTGLTIQLDTGGGDIEEIKRAVDLILEDGNESIIIHHCPTGYPARLDGVNLRILKTLQETFPYPIAFSDHSPGWTMDMLAIALGAVMIEKTITEDRTYPSVEHSMSIEPDEMSLCVSDLRGVETILGNSHRVLTASQLEGRKLIQRSIYIVEDVQAGRVLKTIPVEYRRPGFGLGPDMMEKIKEGRLSRDLKAGHMLLLEDLVF